LVQLRGVVATGLFATARLWPPLQTAQRWLHRAAHVLANDERVDAATVETWYRRILTDMLRDRRDETVAAWATHFSSVTQSYWRGLFHCYAVPELPRTNNELEQYFGAVRHHERRATGHKRPTAALAVRGSVRAVAAVATRRGVWRAQELRPTSIEAWRSLRERLEARHMARRAARRFRRDPATYLKQLEANLLQ
jgi:hypothetical protein